MKQEDTKKKILDKALELFAAQGYDSVSVGEIAQAVGIKAPSLYNHYPSKQAIFDAIVDETAKQYGLDILGRIPIDPNIAQKCDEGNIEKIDAVYLNSAFEAVLKK